LLLYQISDKSKTCFSEQAFDLRQSYFVTFLKLVQAPHFSSKLHKPLFNAGFLA